MSHIEALKEQARRHEQKEEWRKALDAYQKAISRLAEEDDPDIGLHNRVGDLFIRVGEVDEAVLALEQAIELYVDSELPNNAIAVCKKVLRNVPNRHETFLRMGQIRAQQGFLVDARTHFLTYAERMQVAGHLDEALRALVEFADAAPDDTEIRLAIASHFQGHERIDEAVQQLSEGYRSATRQNLTEVAEVFRARLEELRPGFDLSELMSDDSADEPEDFVVETTALGGIVEVEDSGEGEALLSEALASLESDDLALDDLGADDDDETFAMLPDPVDAVADEVAEAIEDAQFGHEVSDEEAPLEASSEDAPLDLEEPPEDAEIGFHTPASLDDAISSIGPDVSHLERERDERNPLEGLDVTSDGVPEIEAIDDFDEDDDAPLPLETFHEPAEGDEAPLFAEAPEDPDLPFLYVPEAVDEGASTLESPDLDDGLGDLGAEEDAVSETQGEDGAEPIAPPFSPPAFTSLPAAISEPDPGDADAGVDQSVDAAPEVDDVDALQRLVETAHRSGDDRALADAYVALGNALRRSGEEARAQAVFRQALQVLPDHPGAREGVDSSPAQERTVTEVASNEDYVDLGALILGESDEKTTRFVVAFEEPSGDEQADFAKMLSQFKAKVAENVDASDVAAHHDLGTAYKEMGLLDEAVEEFQAALRASSDHLPTYEMLGQTFLDKGTPETAVRVLTRALDSPFEVEDELLGIYYYLGRAHELSGNKEQAREFYERVFSLDINFADVTERLRALR